MKAEKRSKPQIALVLDVDDCQPWNTWVDSERISYLEKAARATELADWSFAGY
jgi:hypothetical protein